MSVVWQIELLGGLRAIAGERVVTRFRTQKTASLLAYLACYRTRHPRELLTELFWPDAPADAGRHSLNVAFSALRQALPCPDGPENGIFLADRFSIGLDPERVQIDVAALEDAVMAVDAAGEEHRAAALAEAVARYRGSLLPGYYDDWIFPEQQRLEELFTRCMRRLIDDLELRGRLVEAIPYALRLAAVDRLREEDHRRVIRLYAAAGQVEAALRYYAQVEKVLRREQDAGPEPATLDLVREIRRGRVARSGDLATSSGSGSPSLPAAADTPEAARFGKPSAEPDAEPIGGAVALDSRYYILRDADREASAALEREDSILLVRGARQAGTTSLVARCLRNARTRGCRVALTQMRLLNAAHLAATDALLLALAEGLAEQLDLAVRPSEDWEERRGPNPNFRRYLRRQVLPASPTRLVWALDDVDRLFELPFASEVFGLFRSWYDERVLDSEGPWSAMTLVLAYSTDAHLLIRDPNQSPFNVGTRIVLDDFTLEQVEDLNHRYGSPIRGSQELRRFYRLFGGHPYLVRQALYEMANRGCDLETLETRAAEGDWIFGPHLRRTLALLERDPALCGVVRRIVEGKPASSLDQFYRLRSAGLITGEFPEGARLRCLLYERYLSGHLIDPHLVSTP